MAGSGRWSGTISCNNACIVRSDIGLDSPLVSELSPGTRVTVIEEAEADNRRRLHLSEPCDGWVSGKFVARVESANGGSKVESANGEKKATASTWKAEGQSTLFVDKDAQVSKKTPMGKQIDLFKGDANVDRSFASPAMMATDRVEMSMWLARQMNHFNPSLGDEVKAALLSKATEDEARGGGNKLKIIYIAGVEGTGHHGFMPMLLYPSVRRYGQGALAWWRSFREVLMKTPPGERRAKLAKLFAAMGIDAANSERPHVLFEWCSWPFGEEHRERWAAGCDDPNALQREEDSGNPGNSIDLREFTELLGEHGEVKVLVLHRSLVSASWSHKEWDDGLVGHAKVLALFNQYLTKVLSSLPPEMWRWVAYEDICEAHIGGNFDAVAPIAEFLDLPQAALERSFKYFRPSRKDAASEMSAANLKAIRALEEQKGKEWFSTTCPAQQLLKEFSPPPGQPRRPPPAAPPKVPTVDESTKEALTKLITSFSEEQQRAWTAVLAAEKDTKEAKAATLQKLQQVLSEDQWFLLRKALVHDGSSQAAGKADLDFTAYTCVHFWLGGCGFGSEVNNLISAAVLCEQYGLHCVVEDENWNSGRLHNYLQAEPLICKSCPVAGKCRTLEVKRDRRVATTGWFAVCKHAKGVSFETKAVRTRRLWEYTPETRRRIDSLNRELALPSAFVAVQIRRGDKVAGRRRETLKVTMTDYVKAALQHCRPPCSAVIVCTDDVSAAEEFAAEARREQPGLQVRWRAKKATPGSLRMGHKQEDWNALDIAEREALTQEFLADVEVMRTARVLVCTHSSNVGRLAALLRDGETISLDDKWTNT